MPSGLRSSYRERGAALFILLLLLLVGAGTVFVSRLKSADVELERQRKTAAALAEAKQALIGRAASNDDPGSLPCPDANGDGESKVPEDYSGGACVRYAGHLPWKTLRLPDLRDGDGAPLWYVLAPAFRDRGVAILPSLPGSISIVGVSPANDVVAAVIAPGAPLSGQNRSDVNDLTQYLESYVDPGTLSTAAPGPGFNDRLMLVTASEVRSVSTQRMARELILKNLPHPYPGDVTWFPTTGNWAPPTPEGRWFAWLSIAHYAQVDADKAKLTFTGCGSAWEIRWDGMHTVMTSGGAC